MKRPILLLAFGIVGLIAAPLGAAPLAEIWYVNAGGGPGKVHFSVTSPGPQSHSERAWFGWIWSESKVNNEWPSPYPANKPFNLVSVMPELSGTPRAQSKSGTAVDLLFPTVGVGPGKELWLLRDNPGESPAVRDWEELLDAVESAYRQVAVAGTTNADPLNYRPIGKLGECTIYSVPTLGPSAVDGTWTSFTLPRAAPPQAGDQYDGDLGSDDSRRHDVRVRKYLRWVDDCSGSSSEATLHLFPIFNEPGRFFLEVNQVRVQSLSWRDIAPAGWTPGSRQFTILEPPKFVEPDGLGTLPEDLCSLPSVKPLCADDKAMRERLYLVDPKSNVPSDRQADIRAACEKLLGPGNCRDEDFHLQEGVYRRHFRGNFPLSSKPEVQSGFSQDRVSWRLQQGSSREGAISLKPLDAYAVALKDGSGRPLWTWALRAVSAVSTVVIVLLLVKLRRRNPDLAETKEKNRGSHDMGSSKLPEEEPRKWWRTLLARSPRWKEPSNGSTPSKASAEEPTGLGPELEAQINALVQSALAGLQKGDTTELKQHQDSQKQRIDDLDRQMQLLSKGPKSIDSRLKELRTSLKEELRQELTLEPKIEDACRQIRDTATDEKADFRKNAEEESKKVLKGVLSKISEERDQTLKTIGDEAKKRTTTELDRIQGNLMTRAHDAIAASRKEVLADFRTAARDQITGVVDERWRPYTNLVQKIEPWFREEDRLERVREVLALFERVPNLGDHLKILAERLPYEGFLSAVAPEHLDFPLAFRQQTDEDGRKLYERLNREIESLEPASERERLESSFEALGQLGLWIQALWGAMRVWGSFRDILEILPEPARQEWLASFKFLRSFEVVDAVVFRRIARQRSGILNSAPVTRAEINFLKSNGLLSGEKGLKDRLRLYLVPPGEPGQLGQACIALQYLVEAFPVEQIRDRTRCEEFSIRLRRAAETAGWPTDFHSLIESAAAGAGLRYVSVPYYDSLVGESRYRFIKQSIEAIDLVEKTGRSLPSLDPKSVVRLICPFFFQGEIFYAGRAGIARQ